MSIQTLVSQESEQRGIQKTIDENSIDIALSALQDNAYKYPQESTMRELCMNCADAILERDTALSILSGKTTPEEEFIDRSAEGKTYYNDSQWDPSYYDPNFLSRDKNIYITYRKGEGGGYCDTLEFLDYGCGASPERMYGMLSKLNYSTKRCSKNMAGAFGMGSKSFLGTGCKKAIFTCVYNGRMFKVEAHSNKIISLIGKFNMSTGQKNDFVVIDGHKFYYEVTAEKNHTKIEVPSLASYKQKYIEAAKKQLMFVPNVVFKTVDADGREENIKVKADILFESDHLIVSDNNYFSKPYIVVVKDEKGRGKGVNYGFCEFEDLDLPPMGGSVGIKVTLRSATMNPDGTENVLQDGMLCTPSRESLIFSIEDSSRGYILRKVANIEKEVEQIVNQALDQKDLLPWISACNTILTSSRSRYDSDPKEKALAELSSMLNFRELSPSKSIRGVDFKYASLLEPILKHTVVATKYTLSRDRTKGAYKVEKSGEVSVSSMLSARKNDMLYLGTRSNKSTNTYLARQGVSNWLILLRPANLMSYTAHEVDALNKPVKVNKELNLSKFDLTTGQPLPGNDSLPLSEELLTKAKAFVKLQKQIIDMLSVDSEISDYDSVKVPEGYFEDLKEDVPKQRPTKSPAELRKENAKVLRWVLGRSILEKTELTKEEVKDKVIGTPEDMENTYIVPWSLGEEERECVDGLLTLLKVTKLHSTIKLISLKKSLYTRHLRLGYKPSSSLLYKIEKTSKGISAELTHLGKLAWATRKYKDIFGKQPIQALASMGVLSPHAAGIIKPLLAANSNLEYLFRANILSKHTFITEDTFKSMDALASGDANKIAEALKIEDASKVIPGDSLELDPEVLTAFRDIMDIIQPLSTGFYQQGFVFNTRDFYICKDLDRFEFNVLDCLAKFESCPHWEQVCNNFIEYNLK